MVFYYSSQNGLSHLANNYLMSLKFSFFSCEAEIVIQSSGISCDKKINYSVKSVQHLVRVNIDIYNYY